jgi:CRP-like cAMP-binding protein
MKDWLNKYSIKSIPSGTILLAPGQKTQVVYYLKSGSIRQYSISPNGHELTLHILFPGSIFPAIALYEDSDSRYYYEALQDSEVSLIPLREYEEFLKDNPNDLYELTGRLLRGLDGMAKRIEATAYGDSWARVISVLLYLARHFGEPDGEILLVKIKLTHQQIASFVGVTRERTSIELEKLQKSGLISYKSGVIKIPSVEKLEQELSSKM